MKFWKRFSSKHQDQANMITVINVPETARSTQRLLPASVTLSSQSETIEVNEVSAYLLQRYSRHTEDYQQTADHYYELQKRAVISQPFILLPHESKDLLFDIDIQDLNHLTSEAIEAAPSDKQSITEIITSRPATTNVLQLNTNKENIRYFLKVVVVTKKGTASKLSSPILIQQ